MARERRLIVCADDGVRQGAVRRCRASIALALSEDVLTLTFNGLSKNYRSCGYRAGWLVVSGDAAPPIVEGPEHAGLDAPVRQCARPMGHPDRAGRLSKHRRPGGRRWAHVSPARPGAWADQRHSGVSCVKPKATLYMFPRMDPAVCPITDDQALSANCCRKKSPAGAGTGFNWSVPGSISAWCSCRDEDDLHARPLAAAPIFWRLSPPPWYGIIRQTLNRRLTPA